MQPHWRWLCLAMFLVGLSTAEVNDKEDDDENDVMDTTEANTENQSYLEVMYQTPVPNGDVFFSETFDDGSLDRWVLSKTMKEDADEDISKYDGQWELEELKENKLSGDLGLVLKSTARHHAISAQLKEPFVFDSKPLIVQYEVNFQDGIDCGGAYIKLLSHSSDLNLDEFHDRTAYTIMFGPDKCGEDYKLHFIFRHKNPIIEDYDEKHAKRPEVDLKKYFTDKKTHLYTLILKPDNTYEMLIDQTVVSQGSLLEDVIPPLNPPKEIDDPKDKKPNEWDERPKIPDPDAVKPEDWDEGGPGKIEDVSAVKPEGWLDDEPHLAPDPEAQKPNDWNDDMDGEWEAPLISNPKCKTGCGEWKPPIIDNPNYKGQWKPPMIENPDYQGIWKPRKIPNPHYFEDLNPFRMTPFSAIGLELWSMTSDIYFDNFIICTEKEVADRWASDSWGLKKLVASANEPGMINQLLSAAEERPWLWGLYILTAALPVGLLVLFCWPRKKIEEEDDADFSMSDFLEPDETDLAFQKDMKKGDLESTEGHKETTLDKGLWDDEKTENEEEEEEFIQEDKVAAAAVNQSSDDEMKEADEGADCGDTLKKSLRKRRVRKD
ncbi:calmegin [Rhinoderma darwinii]|uniref:calmegin n=1 Tax=Rhinoderma darwinii TaxID=43563 RepID=UPI003F67ABBA